MATVKVDLTSSWQQLSDGSVSNLILQASSECMIYIGGASAPVENPPIGIKLQELQSGRTFYGTGLVGQKVWGIEYSGFPDASVVVTTW